MKNKDDFIINTLSKDDFFIDMPSEAEKEASVDLIIQKGLIEQRALRETKGLLSFIYEIIIKLGIRTVFSGIEDGMFLAFLIMVFGGGLFMRINERFLCTGTFLISPFLYMLMYVLTMWQEIKSSTYEMKMTCRFTLKHLIAFRMICFGGVSACMNGIIMFFFCYLHQKEYMFFKLLGISLVSLFIYGIITFINLLYYRKPKKGIFILPCLWCGINTLAFLFLDEKFELFLAGIPIFVLFLLCAIAVILYMMGVKRYLFNKDKVIYIR